MAPIVASSYVAGDGAGNMILFTKEPSLVQQAQQLLLQHPMAAAVVERPAINDLDAPEEW